MSWVCPNCCTTNADDSLHCDVCGDARPLVSEERGSSSEASLFSWDSFDDSDLRAEVTPPRRASAESKVVFSDFAVVIESIKGVGRFLFALPGKIIWLCKKIAELFVKLFEKIKQLFGKMKRSRGEVVTRERPPRARREKAPRVRREKPPKKKKVKNSYAKPWPEHHIKFDKEALQAKGYVRSEQETMGSIHGYRLYRADDSSQFIRMEMLLVQKLAVKLS